MLILEQSAAGLLPSSTREELLDTQPHPGGFHNIHLAYVPATGCHMVRVLEAGTSHCLRAILETDEDAARTLFLRLALSHNPETHAI